MTGDPAARLAEAMSEVRLDRLADDLSNARVVGIGPTTREGEQTSGLQHDLTTRLVERGSRLLVVADSTSAGRRLDTWVQGGPGSVGDVLAAAWGPWRTSATAQMLTWLRTWNAGRPARDHVHVAGLTEPAATNADVDAVAGLLDEELDRSTRELLTILRSAHESGEHALRAQHLYDGAPFDVLARRLRATVERSEHRAKDRALVHLDRLVTFHTTSMAQGGDPFAGVGRAAAGLLERLDLCDDRAVLWDGEGGVDARGPGAGRHLRDALGLDYRAVLVTFGGGRLRGAELPEPSAGTLEADLAGLGDVVLDLDPGDRDDEVARWLRGPTQIRVVDGRYRTERDQDFLVGLDSLATSFDHLVHVAEVSATPTGWQPADAIDQGSSRST